jgi:AAA15 family ATPase/GTPase
MIDFFEIKNYKNLDGLKIKSFGKVNLISGKNNTGKTNLLESIGLYITDLNTSYLNFILLDRTNYNLKFEKQILESLYTIFKNRSTEPNSENSEIILKSDYSKILKLVYYEKELIKSGDDFYFLGENKVVKKIIEEDIEKYNIGLLKATNNSVNILEIEEQHFHFSKNSLPNSLTHKLQFIKANQNEKLANAFLWDKINLSDSEKHVVDALKIIDKRIERISFLGEVQRIPVVRLDNKEIYQLKSMGDGINRILTIILALVNVKDGYLFIDEFENGLHYTVQEDLWKIIFQLSEQLNIQVFATTHSSDCIDAFQKTLNNPENKVTGQYIRLENINGEIREVAYSESEVRYASENDIEVR